MFLAPDVFVTSQTLGIADGKPGVFQTLAIMRRLIDEYKKSLAIRQAAASIIFLQPEKDGLHEIQSIFDFVQANVRYTRDIAGVETIQTPERTLALRYGDCDDQTTLFCALAESVGYVTRLIATGYKDASVFEHVYAQVLIGDEWANADATEDGAFGYAPPDPLILWTEAR